jgi:hypothetical protein
VPICWRSLIAATGFPERVTPVGAPLKNENPVGIAPPLDVPQGSRAGSLFWGQDTHPEDRRARVHRNVDGPVPYCCHLATGRTISSLLSTCDLSAGRVFRLERGLHSKRGE